MSANQSKTITSYLDQAESQLEKIFGEKAPALPDNAQEILVKIAPYLTILGIVVTLPIILGALGISTVLMPISLLGGYRFGLANILSLIFTLGTIILQIMAVPGLFKRQLKAWRLMFYESLLVAAQNLLTFNLGGLVIGSAISFYFLFQLKAKYK